MVATAVPCMARLTGPTWRTAVQAGGHRPPVDRRNDVGRAAARYIRVSFEIFLFIHLDLHSEYSKFSSVQTFRVDEERLK